MLRTLWVWLVGIFLMLSAGTLLILFSFVDSSGKSLHVLARAWAWGILKAAGVRVEVKGLENLSHNSPQILASNHQSYFDIFALMAYIPIPCGWLTKKELFLIPIFGLAMKRFGNVRIDRSDHEKAQESLRIAARRIREGRSLLIFPEGTRSPDGHLLPFKKGCYYLAEASDAPVIPISISGSFHIMPKKQFRVRPGSMHMVIGSPLRVERSSPNEREDFMTRLREEIIRNQVPVS